MGHQNSTERVVRRVSPAQDCSRFCAARAARNVGVCCRDRDASEKADVPPKKQKPTGAAGSKARRKSGGVNSREAEEDDWKGAAAPEYEDI